MRRFLKGFSLGVLLTLVLLAMPGVASGVRQSIVVYFNGSKVHVNGKPVNVDSLSYNGTIYIPLRQVSEILNKDVYYDAASKIANISDKIIESKDEVNNTYSSGINGVVVGITKDELINTLGLPNRVDPSVYGFTWYIYNNEYEKYVQAGIKDNKVVAVYSNIGDWNLEHSINIGLEKSVVDRKLGSSLPTITQDNYTYSIINNDEFGLYKFNKDLYSYIFYDLNNNKTVTAIMIWDKGLPFNDMYLGNYHDFDDSAWQHAMSQQMFDLSNSFRVRVGLEAFEWDTNVATVAYMHSYDMSSKKYFEHENLEGQSPFDRMKSYGIKYLNASENLATGQINSIFAIQALMNSKSHQENILGEFKKLGVGVHFNVGSKQVYYTQDFYTPYE